MLKKGEFINGKVQISLLYLTREKSTNEINNVTGFARVVSYGSIECRIVRSHCSQVLRSWDGIHGQGSCVKSRIRLGKVREPLYIATEENLLIFFRRGRIWPLSFKSLFAFLFQFFILFLGYDRHSTIFFLF